MPTLKKYNSLGSKASSKSGSGSWAWSWSASWAWSGSRACLGSWSGLYP